MLTIKQWVSAGIIVALAVCLQVRADSPQQVDIPAGDLVAALKSLARQADVELVFQAKELKGLRTEGLKGTYALKDVVTWLLKGTRLTFHTDASGAMLILGPGKEKSSGVSEPAGQMRVAMVVEEEQEKTAVVQSRDVMIVEGERGKPKPFSTGNLDLTRTEDDALAFVTFSARDIELSGASNLHEFLDNRLSQNFNADLLAERDGLINVASADAKGVNMRGRGGGGETVILLNGRRMAPQYEQALPTNINGSPDLRSIPLGSIERIEILPSAGSAIYGAGAISGVINIITRKDYRGGQVVVNYESPADVHAPRRSIDASYSFPLRWGLGLRLSAGYAGSDALRTEQRRSVTIDRWRRAVLEREPGRMMSRTGSVQFGATTNIRTTSTSAAANLFGPGTANFASVPSGYTGDGGLEVFQARQGQYSIDLLPGQADPIQRFGADRDERMLGLGLDGKMGPHLDWSLEYRHTRTQSEEQGSSALYSGTGTTTGATRLPGAAPGNPFGQDVYVYFFDPNLDRPELSAQYTTVNYQVSGTLRAQMGQWRGFLDTSYSHGTNEYRNATFFQPLGGWSAAFLSGAYDPLVDFSVMAPADSSFYDAYVRQLQRVDGGTKTWQAALKASGPVSELPAGSIYLTAGVDWTYIDRYRAFADLQWTDSVTGLPWQTSQIINAVVNAATRQGEFKSTTLYAEATVPVIGPRQQWPWARALDVIVSGRLDRREAVAYRSNLSVLFLPTPASQPAMTLWQVPVEMESTKVHALGLRYEPIEGVTFRASRSLGFRPPELYQILPADPVTYNTNVTDPARGNQAVTLAPSQFAIGGNPDLRAELVRSTNIGLIFAPPGVPGLRMSVDYLQDLRSDFIASVSAQTVLNLEAAMPGRVQRGPPDGHVSGVGPISFVDARYTNFLRTSAESVDFSVEQAFDDVSGGRLVFSAAVTRNLSFKLQTSPTLPAIEQVRNNSVSLSNQMKWNGNGQVQWQGREWALGWSARYFDTLLVADADRLLQGSDRADRAWNHDMFVSYRAPALTAAHGLRYLLSGTSMTLGVKNVFDRAPRFWAASTQRGIVSADSIVGRSLWLQLRKSFE